jgi:hypothetical protein
MTMRWLGQIKREGTKKCNIFEGIQVKVQINSLIAKTRLFMEDKLVLIIDIVVPPIPSRPCTEPSQCLRSILPDHLLPLLRHGCKNFRLQFQPRLLLTIVVEVHMWL